MRKFLALSIGLLLLPVAAFAGANWLNYEKEANLYARITCDNGNALVTLYEHINYDLDVLATSQETYFLLLDGRGEQFFVKSDGEIVSMTHEAWDAKLAAASPNVYAFSHGIQNDCRPTN